MRNRIATIVAALIFAMLAILLALASVPGAAASSADYNLYSSDITSGAQAIESGHYSEYIPSLAFDNTSTYWVSVETGANVSNVSYVGQNFGASYSPEIRRVGFLAYGVSGYSVSSYWFQYSDDGANWSACGDLAYVTYVMQWQYSYYEACGTHRYWRILANSATGSSYWFVTEIEMFTLVSSQTETPTPVPIAYQSTLSTGETYEISRSATFGEIAIFAGIVFAGLAVITLIFVQVSHARTI